MEWPALLRMENEYAVSHGLLPDFQACNSDEERIAYCGRNISLMKKVESWLEPFGRTTFAKSEEKALSAKNEGNEYFRRKEYELAFESYTMCILWVPHDSSSDVLDQFSSKLLAIGYANRSAAAFHLEKYKICLEDIKRAIQAGYSVKEQYKLLHRRVQCFGKQGLKGRAALAARELLALLQEIKGIPSNKRAELRKALALHCKTPATYDIDVEDNYEGDAGTLPYLAYGENKKIACASKALDMKYSVDKGRYIVANKSLNSGETLFVESPFASVLLPDHYGTHCHHCHDVLEAPVPCHNCAQVRYCSFLCKMQSWTLYHHVECRHLDILHVVGIAHLCLRVIVIAGVDYLLSNMEKLRLLSSSESIDVTTPYSGSYFCVHSLVTHTEDIKVEDLYSYTLTGYLLLRLLKRAVAYSSQSSENCYYMEFQALNSDGIVGGKPLTDDTVTAQILNCSSLSLNDKLERTNIQASTGTCSSCSAVSNIMNEEEVFIGSLLLRHLQQLICNAHAITELQIHTEQFPSIVQTEAQQRIATAIYPAASLMNHSCDPNIISSFIRNMLVVRTLRDVHKDGEIYNCYGPHYCRMTFKERQVALQGQYFFKCHCERCENESTEKDLSKSLFCPVCDVRLSCSTDTASDVKCESCGHLCNYVDMLQDIVTATQLYDEAVDLLDHLDFEDALCCLKKCLILRQKWLSKHQLDLIQTHDLLARTYALQENFVESLVHLRLSLKYLENRYGKDSIEVANELHKFSDVLGQVLMKPQDGVDLANIKGYADEMTSAVERGIHIFSLLYGEWHPSVKQMKEKMSFVAAVNKSIDATFT